MQKRFKPIWFLFCALIVFPLFIWLGAIAKTEYLTYRHGGTFAELYKQCTMVEDVVRFKVIEYSDNRARVYYVEKNQTGGFVFVFEKLSGDWEMTFWDCVWAKMGSADGFIWPYIR